MSKINLIKALRIAQPILVPIWLPVLPSNSSQLLDVAVISHFEIDADAAVQGKCGIIDIEIRHSGFDDLCDDGVWILLVIRDTDFDSMARIKLFSNRRWQVG